MAIFELALKVSVPQKFGFQFILYLMLVIQQFLNWKTVDGGLKNDFN